MQELSMNVLDIAENSVKAGASLIEITLTLDRAASRLTLCVKDNGCGMSEELAARVTDPFCTSRTTRKVGLGLPFLKMAAELAGGGMKLESQPGLGTTVTAWFTWGHIDLAPLGDMAGTLAGQMQCNPQTDFVYTLTADGESFCADSRQFREILGDVPLSSPEVALFIRDYISENSAPLLEKEKEQ